jgi:pyruvate dehydrogenase E2 component (dihydrolipoamide acetyltransferase)
MPKWGIEMTEGTITQWNVALGERVTKGAPLLDVETEKIVNSAEAAADGVLRRILAASGDVRPVGALLGVIAEVSVGDPSIDEFIANFSAASVSFELEGGASIAAAPLATPEAVNAGDVRVSPIARRLAELLGIDPSRVTGTGRNGRVSKEDVEAFAAQRTTPSSMQEPAERRRFSPTRATIARRLLESKQTIPHYRLAVEADAGRLLERKSELSQATGQRISVNDLLVRACALALVRHPAINVQLEGDEVLFFAHADVAIAIATDNGLVAPIVRAADLKSPREIAAATADLAQRAASGTLQRADLSGGTFTLSNLGMFGVARFDAIINPPQVAILAVGAAEQRVVSRQGAPAIARMMTLTLSADHRVVDGAVAAEFLATLRSLIEQPQTL